MNEQALSESVFRIVVSQFGCDRSTITAETDLHNTKDGLSADDLDLIELIIECEEAFDIRIPDCRQDGIKTIGDLISLVKELLGFGVASG